MHPSLRILALVLLAVSVQLLGMASLAAVGLLLLIPAFSLYGNILRSMLRRSRWLFLTVLLVFALTTPGEYPAWWDWAVAPTYEGLRLGLLQATRLAIMLTALALLLGTTPRASLMAGIYLLLRPLRYLGVRPERFTARLWLTLHYAEEEPLLIRNMRWDSLGLAEEDRVPATVERVPLMMPQFAAQDWSILLGMVALGLWWLT